MATFTLNNVPGFADQSDSICAAEDPSLGLILGRISSNAAFGMARLEVFQGWYYDGQTVDLPVSTIDGYEYSRDELTYVWGVHATGNKDSMWASYGPPWAMWYAAYNVDQSTGLVSCAAGYRGNPDHSDRQAHTNDGVLKVWTIAQRQKTTMTMATIPYFKPHLSTDFATDKPLYTGTLVDMNNSAKASVVNVEAIYMGEFKNGDVIPSPVSPVDGYTYPQSQIFWMCSLRWTMDDNGGSPPTAKVPDLSKGQMKGWANSVNPTTRAVTCNVTYDTGGGGSATTYNTGRIMVVALCARNSQVSQVSVDAKKSPWSTTGGINSAYNFTGVNNSTGQCRIAVTPGDTISITRVSGFWSQSNPAAGSINPSSPSGVGTWDANGDPSHLSNKYHTGTSGPDNYVNANTTNAMMLGAWVDSTGQLVQDPIAIGNSSGTLTVPAGAAYLQLGINDGGTFLDNDGSILVQVVQSGGLAFTGHSFGEIDPTTFFPGATLRASTMLQLEKNIEEAWCSPELFGPTLYSHGSTVPLPVSPIDGYTYSRSELFYIWSFSNTGPDAGDNHNRMTCEAAGVDPTTGAVTINSYETSTSSDGWFLNHDGQLRVIVLGMRSAQVPALTFTDVQPASGVSGSNPDASSGNVTFNGV